MPDSLLARVDEVPRFAAYGRVTRVVGLVIETCAVVAGASSGRIPQPLWMRYSVVLSRVRPPGGRRPVSSQCVNHASGDQLVTSLRLKRQKASDQNSVA